MSAEGTAAAPKAPAEASASEPQQQQSTSQQQQQQGRGSRNQQGSGGGRGRGRGGRGRGTGGRGGSQGRASGGPTSISPGSGVPYGHVPGYLPGSSSLVEELDKRVLIVLRDGRHLIGMLRSFDQFSNMVLEDASERKMHRSADGVTYFSDVPLGVYIVRGDSMVLLGQVSTDEGMKKVEPSELNDLIQKANSAELPWDFDKDLLA